MLLRLDVVKSIGGQGRFVSSILTGVAFALEAAALTVLAKRFGLVALLLALTTGETTSLGPITEDAANRQYIA